MDSRLGSVRTAAGAAMQIALQSILSLRNNWGLGVLSLALAASLWVFVTDRENPDRTVRVPGEVPIQVVNVPIDQAVFSLSESHVTLRARAPQSVAEGLAADDFQAEVDLAGVTSRTATVRVHVESSESRADVIEISPAEVTVTLEDVTAKSVPVATRLVGAPPRGFRTGAIIVEPIEASVSGPESLVEGVTTVDVDINLTGVRSDFEQTLLLQPRDGDGNDINGLRARPEGAVVRVQVIQVEFSRSVPVRPTLIGAPAGGYNVTGIDVDPAVVDVTGSVEVLQRVDASQGISTEVVSIDGASENVELTVGLSVPEGASVSEPSVTVRVTIEPQRGQLTFSVVPAVTGLGSGLLASLAPSSIEVVLAAPLPDLAALDPSAIVATVDARGLGPGEHRLSVRVQAPPGTRLVSVTPPEVRVTIRSQ